ncbi:MAG: methyltransferase domain-containing protein [Pseudonocardiaceae bacterium]|nr:methyltransferase domain-containing protein [Pseudonocardiaceae bacterium]
MHTHDDIDWSARLSVMRRGDLLRAGALRDTARRLSTGLPEDARVLDIGCGTGGMGIALAELLGERGGGTVVLVDAVPELLDEAGTAVRAVAGEVVRVHTVLADLAGDELVELLDPAHLVWASRVLHHLPDQQAGLNRLTRTVRTGGTLAISEGGLQTSCLPWDIGVGEPGLEERLHAAREEWFRGMRAGMPDAVRMPYGWPVALAEAGLTAVSSFSYLVDHPAPASHEAREHAIERVGWLAEVGEEWLSEQDRQVVRRLLDPADDAYLGARDDLFLLYADTIHCGRK